jgi:flap endonuclease-1
MGINGLNKLITKNGANSLVTVPLTKFSGRRIAIDSEQWIKANLSTARKKVIFNTDLFKTQPNQDDINKELITSVINFITKVLRYGITPVFVFDGEHPIEKTTTKQKRTADKLKMKQKIDDLYSDLHSGRGNPDEIIKELRKALCNYSHMPSKDYYFFRDILKALGVPCLISKTEAETLCSSLCIEGKVAAVYSTDTDNLAYGCPLLIKSFSDHNIYDENNNIVHQFECVRLDYLLGSLNVSHDLFVDICIMAGCDYNKNIKGIASINAYKELVKYGSIDNLPDKYDKTCLDHLRVRQLFTHTTSSLLYDLKSSLNISEQILIQSKQYLLSNGIFAGIDRLLNFYKVLPLPIEGHIENITIVTPYHYLHLPLKFGRKIITFDII